MSTKLTWKSHVAKWKDCDKCPLHLTRTSIVLAKGNVPCDVMFIGEAPGRSEDMLGRPFVGPAGILLDQMIERAMEEVWVCAKCRYGGKYIKFPVDKVPGHCPTGHSDVHQAKLRLAFTNLVCCIPLDEDNKKTKEPDHEAVVACKPRLDEFLVLGNPKVVLAVGKVPFTYTEQGVKGNMKLPGKCYVAQITHPAAILRAPIAQQSLMRQRVVVAIRQAVSKGLGV